jgi:hypothetical protein
MFMTEKGSGRGKIQGKERFRAKMKPKPGQATVQKNAYPSFPLSFHKINAQNGCPEWMPRMDAQNGCPEWMPRMNAQNECPD